MLLSMGAAKSQTSPGDLPDPGIKTASFRFPALAGGFFSAIWEAHTIPAHSIFVVGFKVHPKEQS